MDAFQVMLTLVLLRLVLPVGLLLAIGEWARHRRGHANFRM